MAVKNRVVLNFQHHSTNGAGKTGHQCAKKTERLNSNNARRKNLDLYLELQKNEMNHRPKHKYKAINLRE